MQALILAAMLAAAGADAPPPSVADWASAYAHPELDTSQAVQADVLTLAFGHLELRLERRNSRVKRSGQPLTTSRPWRRTRLSSTPARR